MYGDADMLYKKMVISLVNIEIIKIGDGDFLFNMEIFKTVCKVWRYWLAVGWLLVFGRQ